MDAAAVVPVKFRLRGDRGPDIFVRWLTAIQPGEDCSPATVVLMRLAMVGALVLASVAACTVTVPTAPPSPAVRSSSAAPASGFPAQPDGVPYPTTSWPRADWPREADRSTVDRVVNEAFAGGAAKRVPFGSER